MQSLFISERTTEHSNNTVMSFDWCQCGAASVSRNRSWYAGGPPSPPHLLLVAQMTTEPRWPLRGPTPTLTLPGLFTDSEDPTITARLFNAKPGLTSWPHLAPAFCGQERTGLMFLGAVCSRLLMWNNIGITRWVKHQHIRFCSAVPIATCKQRHCSRPNFAPPYSAPLCIVPHFVFVA